MNYFAHHGVEHATQAEAFGHLIMQPLVLGAATLTLVIAIFAFRHRHLRDEKVNIRQKEQE